MWLAFLPLTKLLATLGGSVAAGYGLTLLAADAAMLAVLRRMTAASDRQLLWLYWLSPISLFATYWLGLNDVVPVLLLLLGLDALRALAPRRAALWVALAVSAKLSMALAIPFLAVYLFHNKRLRRYCAPFAAVLAAALAVLQVPYLLSPGGWAMLSGNPELAKVYDATLALGDGQRVYLLPLGYVLAVFAAWRVRRASFDLLLAMLGLAFFLVLLLTPASAGWFVWVLPFLVLYQAGSDRRAAVLVAAFSLLYVGLNGLIAPLPSLRGIEAAHWPAGARASELLGLSAHAVSLGQTLLLAAGLILVARMLRQGVQANEYFRLSRKPLVIGIAGDSGSGKDTLVASIVDMFGAHSVARVSGDNYHLWDREQPIWRVMTHLHPRANELSQLAQDLQTLTNGTPIRSRPYDHATGKRGAPVALDSNDFIVVSGLHALSLPLLRSLYDLKIFLDMDEGLRRELKTRRDVGERGRSPQDVHEQLERREADAQQFIRPQAAWADLVLSVRRAAGGLALGVRARQWLRYGDLARVLVEVCRLRVSIDEETAEGTVALTIEGEPDREDIARAVRALPPGIDELLDVAPRWQDGMNGVMQLVVLTHISQALRLRLSPR
jgi:uridine kinase